MRDTQMGRRIGPRLLHESEYVGQHSVEQEFVFETFMYHIQRAYLEHGFRGVVEVSEKMTAAAQAYGIDTARDINAVCKLLYNGYDNLLDVSKAA
jgi:hypothetical protein